jgi:hypothetical protein
MSDSVESGPLPGSLREREWYYTREAQKRKGDTAGLTRVREREAWLG